MKNYKRVFLIVLDSFGIGEAPDAALFGDSGANTLRSVSKSKELYIPNLIKMGLGNIDGVDSVSDCEKAEACHLRLSEISRGKDTTVGHWELMGIVSENPLPTYPDGFPDEVINEIERVTARGVLCNLPYSGTEVIKKYGKESTDTGKLIVYTSADSVLQIAANEAVVPVEELYAICKDVRKIMTGKNAVGRIIARPFIETEGGFIRTDRRRDFSLEPPTQTALDKIKNAGLDVIAVGKISDIFAGKGITESIPTHGNTEGIKLTRQLVRHSFRGLCFINLVDFDMLYGHRQDADGYARALSEFDAAIPGIAAGLSHDDLLIITADHGCDPSDNSTDHTREYVPVLIYRKGEVGINLGTKRGFGSVGRLVCDSLGVETDSDIFEDLSQVL